MKRWNCLLLASVLLVGTAAPLGATQRADGIRWEPHEATLAGQPVEGAQLGRLTVPENRSAPAGRTIELAFVRLPGREGGTPTIYLDGGPGGSGVGVLQLGSWEPLLEGLREVGDVILLSQRGTGLSRPRLLCGLVRDLSGDVLVSRDRMLEELAPSLEACVQRWRDEADISAYNTRESAADVEAVRTAIGVERVNLLGFSYGTHLGLAFLREYDASISRAVLAGVEGPDQTFKLPSTLDTQLRTLSRLVAKDDSTSDEFADLYADLRELIAELDREPRLMTLEDGTRIRLGGDGLRYLIRRDIGDTNDIPMLPALLEDVRSDKAPLLTALVARRFGGLNRGIHLMSIAMDCASAGSPGRLQRIRSEYAASVLGTMTDSLFPDVCAHVPVEPLPEDYRTPVRSDVPTLFISGTLDANTPPYQGEMARWGFPNGVHLIVENAGHESTLPAPEVQSAVVRFLQGGEITDGRVTLPPLDFLDRDEVLTATVSRQPRPLPQR